MPMPMTPHVPLSRRWRGTCMSITLRPMSRALAPSLKMYVSGGSCTTSRTAFRAPMNCIGCGSALRRPPILARLWSGRAAGRPLFLPGRGGRDLAGLGPLGERVEQRLDVSDERGGDGLVAVHLLG